MKKYYVGARNRQSEAYTVVVATNCLFLARFMMFFTRPFVNEIEITEKSNVEIIKRPMFLDDMYYHKNKDFIGDVPIDELVEMLNEAEAILYKSQKQLREAKEKKEEILSEIRKRGLEIKHFGEETCKHIL